MTDPQPVADHDTRSRVMDGLRAWFPAAVSVFVLVGCIVLFTEMMISGHDRGEARIGIIFAGIGMVVAAVSAVIVVLRLRIPDVARAIVVAAWLLLAVGGLVGTWDHLKGEEGDEGRVAAQEAGLAMSAPSWTPAAYDDDEGGGDEGGAGDEGGPEGKRPPLAPISFTGPGLLGALAFIIGTERGAVADRRPDLGA